MMYFSQDLKNSFWFFIARVPIWVVLHLFLFNFLSKTDVGSLSLLLLIILNTILSFSLFWDDKTLSVNDRKLFTRLVQFYLNKLNRSNAILNFLLNFLFLALFFVCTFIAGFFIVIDYLYINQKSNKL